jgi:hypothetical protein
LVIGADLSSSYGEYLTGSRGKSYCKYKECAGWSALWVLEITAAVQDYGGYCDKTYDRITYKSHSNVAEGEEDYFLVFEAFVLSILVTILCLPAHEQRKERTS